MLRTVVYDGVVMSPHPSAWLLHGTMVLEKIIKGFLSYLAPGIALGVLQFSSSLWVSCLRKTLAKYFLAQLRLLEDMVKALCNSANSQRAGQHFDLSIWKLRLVPLCFSTMCRRGRWIASWLCSRMGVAATFAVQWVAGQADGLPALNNLSMILVH